MKNLQEQISRIQSMMGLNESSETTDDVVGKEFWFEYHCFESPKSCDAELWYRTHNKVLVLSIEEHGCGDTKLERLLEGCPRVYRVVFEDGFEYDVFEDELMESKEEFERPDAPKRNQQENIRKVLRKELNEIRVPRDERVELYKDDNIIVVVPLTHRSLQKYAHRCQWCINDDKGEWEDYHKGLHAVIIQRKPKKVRIGVTDNPTASEIFMYEKLGEGGYDFDDVQDILSYEFKNENKGLKYLSSLVNDIDNFATNITYYSPTNGIYDMEDNLMSNYGFEITDIPNVTDEVKVIMDDYLQEE